MLSTAGLLVSFAMHAPFARSDYYETSAPPGGHQPATDLPAAGLAARREGRPQAVPTFTTESIKELGTRLYPGSLAMPTPQALRCPEASGQSIQ
jgi:hypothetical protein